MHVTDSNKSPCIPKWSTFPTAHKPIFYRKRSSIESDVDSHNFLCKLLGKIAYLTAPYLIADLDWMTQIFSVHW